MFNYMLNDMFNDQLIQRWEWIAGARFHALTSAASDRGSSAGYLDPVDQ